MFSGAGTFHDDEAGLVSACHIDNTVEADILAGSRTPAAVEPEDVDGAVARHQFLHLVIDEAAILLPAFGVLADGVVVEAVVRSSGRPPVVGAVPVGLREVAPRHHPFGTEGIEDVACHIRTRVTGKAAVGHGVVRLAGVEKAESVVMLGGEDNVLHPCFAGYACPLCGVEAGGVEVAAQAPVPLFILLVGAGGVGGYPVLAGNGPRLADAGDGIDTPVEDDAELEVLPCLQVADDGRVIGPLVAGALLVDVALSRDGGYE